MLRNGSSTDTRSCQGRQFSNGKRGRTQVWPDMSRPIPFMRPAFDLSEDDAIAAFKAIVVSEVEKHMKGQ